MRTVVGSTSGNREFGAYRACRRGGRAVALAVGFVFVLLAVFGLAPVAQAAPAPLVQFFYVPFPEDQLLAMMSAVTVGSPSPGPTEPMTSYITITAVADGTVIYYDQWENGYDVDLSNTLDTYNAVNNPDGTQIWGDGNPANGAPPGIPSDIINAGTVILLQNDVVTTTRGSVIQFDGGDKFAATKTIAVTRTTWAATTGTLLAGSVEVFDTNNWGTEYRAPVGTNTDEYVPAVPDYQMFEYTALSIMAGEGGATIDVDTDADGVLTGPNDLAGYVLAEGQSTYVTDVHVGAHVTSSRPVQVDIFSGDIGSNYESRDSALIPTNMWTDRYYTPTSTTHIPTGPGDERTTVWLYNDGASAITVTYQRRDATGARITSNISVPAGRVAKQILDNAVDGTGACLYTSNLATFYAYSTTDSASAANSNQGWDWSFTLIPDDMLTTQGLVGLGIGRDPTSGVNPLENGNPIWVTTVGNGDTAADVYVDYDSDPATGRFTDPSGYKFDAKYTLRELDQARVYVPPTTATGVVVSASTLAAQTNAAATTLTFAHDNSAAAKNRLLLVGVAIANEVGVERQVLGVTFGGVPLTYINSRQAPTGGGGVPNSLPRVELWGLANPPRGAGNIVVTLTGSRAFTAGATTFSGVDVANGLSSAIGTWASAASTGAGSRNLSVAVATSAGQVVYDVAAIETYVDGNVGTLTVGTGQTSRWNQLARTATSGTRRSIRGAGSTKTATGATTTMAWTASATYPWAIGAVPVKPMPAGTKMDQTGILIYTLSTSVKLAIAWGQDPWEATYGAPGLDVGTSVPPTPEFQAGKDGVLYDVDPNDGIIDGDHDGDGFVGPGDEIEYPITVSNISRLPVPDVIVWDTIPAHTTYVPNSTYLDGTTQIPDDTSGTPFPLDGAGYNVGTLLVGAQKTVTFRVIIGAYETLGGISAIANGGEGRALGHTRLVDDDAFLRGRVSDYVWFDTDGDGVQDPGEPPVGGIQVRLLKVVNGVGTPVFDTNGNEVFATTDQNGFYQFLGLPPDNYIVKFVAADGTTFTQRDATTEDKDSDANPTAGTTYGQTDQIVLGGGQKYYDADAGLVMIKPTLAVISSFDAYTLGDKVVVNWVTASETNTAGFDLQRLDPGTNEWVTVNQNLVPALFESPNGGTYSIVDTSGRASRSITYRLVEVETSGATVIHGPYEVSARQALPKGQAYTELSDGADMARVSRSVRLNALHISAATSGQTKVASATADRLRIQVTDPGLYKVVAADLVSGLRLTDARARQLIRTKGLELTSKGKSVAYLATADGSALYFYGEAIDSVYATDNVYWLKVGKGTGMALGSMKPAASATGAATTTTGAPVTTTTTTTAPGPTSTSAPTSTTETGTSETVGELALSTGDSEPTDTTVSATTTSELEVAASSFVDSIHFEKDLVDAPTLFHDPQADIWMWDYLVAGYAPLSSKTISVTVPGVVSGRTLTVQLQGLVTTEEANEHHVQVALNGTVLGDSRWEGAVPHVVSFDIPAGVLRAGENEVQLVALLDSGIDYSLVGLDSLDVTYERSLNAVGDQLLFSLGDAGLARVGGLSSTDAWILDLADPTLPRVIDAGASGGVANDAWVEFDADASDYLVATAAGALRPRAITAVAAPTLRAAGRGADYVVITSPNLTGAAGRLASYRAKDGFRTAVVTTAEIYDAFNYGLASPQAIKDFITYAATKWKPAARFVVLAGEGSYDYKDNMGNGDSLVPCLLIDSADGLVASDVTLADYKGGDGVPEIAIGRIPALNETELDAALAKIRAYEAAPMTQKRTALLAADNSDNAGDFAADSEAMASLISRTVRVDKAYLDGANLETVRSAVRASFSNGTLLVNYVGHASVGQFAEESLLSTADVPNLGTNSRLPVVTAFTCVVGQYALPGYDSLSEALAMRAKAGAIAVWAPTALEDNIESAKLGALFMKNLFGKNRTVRLGSVIQATLKAAAAQDVPVGVLATYNLLGDPALKVRW
jgi:uncharacterized repeat protein (TIGR01451 family)